MNNPAFDAFFSAMEMSTGPGLVMTLQCRGSAEWLVQPWAILCRCPSLRCVGNGDLGGFIESGMLEHKTSRRTLGRRLLPVAGLAFGIRGFDRATPWLEVRARCVLNAALDKCLMRSPSIDCTWAASHIATSVSPLGLCSFSQGMVALTDDSRVAGAHALCSLEPIFHGNQASLTVWL